MGLLRRRMHEAAVKDWIKVGTDLYSILTSYEPGTAYLIASVHYLMLPIYVEIFLLC